VIRKTTTLIATRILVTIASLARRLVVLPHCALRPLLDVCRRCRRLAGMVGQRRPTGAKVTQSVQIGRPHSEHDNPVSRSGWR
jgi:hypothetical protein